MSLLKEEVKQENHEICKWATEICLDLVLLQVVSRARDCLGFALFINFGEGQEEKEHPDSPKRF